MKPRLTATDRRQSILEAAEAVILKKGLTRAATRDVTEALGVATGLLHHHFPSFEALRHEVVRRAAASEIAEVEAALAARDPEAGLGFVLAWMVPDADPYWRLWLDAREEAHRNEAVAAIMAEAQARWIGLIAALIARGVASGAFACADPTAAAWRLTALAEGLAGYVLSRQPLLSAEAMAALLRGQARAELGVALSEQPSA